MRRAAMLSSQIGREEIAPRAALALRHDDPARTLIASLLTGS
jgi:hypothetical protein